MARKYMFSSTTTPDDQLLIWADMNKAYRLLITSMQCVKERWKKILKFLNIPSIKNYIVLRQMHKLYSVNDMNASCTMEITRQKPWVENALGCWEYNCFLTNIVVRLQLLRPTSLDQPRPADRIVSFANFEDFISDDNCVANSFVYILYGGSQIYVFHILYFRIEFRKVIKNDLEYT